MIRPIARLVNGWVAGLTVAVLVPTIAVIFGGRGESRMLAAAAIPIAVASLGLLLAPRVAIAGRPGSRFVGDAVLMAALVGLTPAGPDGRSALLGLASGPARLITANLPAASGGPELAITLVAIALATAVAIELATPGRRLAWLLPAVGLYLAAVLVGAGGQSPPAADAVALVGVIAAGLLVRRAEDRAGPDDGGPRIAGRGQGRSRPSPGRVAARVAAVVAVTALALPLAHHLPGAGARTPYDVRSALVPPPRPAQQTSLLATYASVYDGPVHPAFSARVVGANPTDLYWRLAVFDHFDGLQWTPTGAFRRAGTALPRPSAPISPARAVTATVSLDTPFGYLPAPDRPVGVSVGGLDVSASDGVLALPVGHPPVSGYTVQSMVAEPSRTDLLAASSPAGGTDPGSPPFPQAVSTLASTLIANAPPSPFARLTAIADYLTRAPFARHPPGHSPIGSGDYQIVQLLNQSHDGSAEQYAAAFAILARAVGFQSRLAIGYVGGRLDRSTGVTDFTTRDLTVWPEVRLAGLGWVPFPAVPAERNTPAVPPSSPLGQAMAAQRALDASPQLKLPGGTGRAGAAHPAKRASGPPAVVVATAGAVGALLAALTGLLVAKYSRRRRQRRQPDPGRRVAGAWEHMVDRMVERGITLPPSLTTDEVAARAAGHLGVAESAPLRALVAVVDAARYDRRFPPSPTTADEAWARAAEFERALRRHAPPLTRLRARLSPAPLRRVRPPRPKSRSGAKT